LLRRHKIQYGVADGTGDRIGIGSMGKVESAQLTQAIHPGGGSKHHAQRGIAGPDALARNDQIGPDDASI
jgi:hypothetical protein